MLCALVSQTRGSRLELSEREREERKKEEREREKKEERERQRNRRGDMGADARGANREREKHGAPKEWELVSAGKDGRTGRESQERRNRREEKRETDNVPSSGGTANTHIHTYTHTCPTTHHLHP